MLLQFQIAELASFLKYGITGLSAIAFILSYFLLYREGNRAKPRAEYLSSIRMFMWLTLILGVVSAYVALKNPSLPTATEPRQTTKKSVSGSLLAPKNRKIDLWTVEIFYDKKMREKALEVQEVMELDEAVEVKVTLLGKQKRQELQVERNQIRHEATEKKMATGLKDDLKAVLNGNGIGLKLIRSSSPKYISVFLVN